MWLNVWIQREVGASAVYSGFCLGGELVGRMFYLMSVGLSACSTASGLSVSYFSVFRVFYVPLNVAFIKKNYDCLSLMSLLDT